MNVILLKEYQLIVVLYNFIVYIYFGLMLLLALSLSALFAV